MILGSYNISNPPIGKRLTKISLQALFQWIDLNCTCIDEITHTISGLAIRIQLSWLFGEDNGRDTFQWQLQLLFFQPYGSVERFYAWRMGVLKSLQISLAKCYLLKTRDHKDFDLQAARPKQCHTTRSAILFVHIPCMDCGISEVTTNQTLNGSAFCFFAIVEFRDRIFDVCRLRKNSTAACEGPLKRV